MKISLEKDRITIMLTITGYAHFLEHLKKYFADGWEVSGIQDFLIYFYKIEDFNKSFGYKNYFFISEEKADLSPKYGLDSYTLKCSHKNGKERPSIICDVDISLKRTVDFALRESNSFLAKADIRLSFWRETANPFTDKDEQFVLSLLDQRSELKELMSECLKHRRIVSER